MKVPQYDIPALRRLYGDDIEHMYDVSVREATTDLRRRIIGQIYWDMCIVQQGHGMLLLQEDDKTHKVTGIYYRYPSCGEEGAGAQATARMLVLLGVQAPIGELLRGVITQAPLIVVPNLNTDSPVVETP